MGLEHFEQRSNVPLADGGREIAISREIHVNPLVQPRGGCHALAYNVTALAVTLLVEGVEGLPPETRVAGDASETFHVEHLLHGDAAAAVADHVVAAPGTAAWRSTWGAFV